MGKNIFEIRTYYKDNSSLAKTPINYHTYTYKGTRKEILEDFNELILMFSNIEAVGEMVFVGFLEEDLILETIEEFLENKDVVVVVERKLKNGRD